jgi:hypothetical protein
MMLSRTAVWGTVGAAVLALACAPKALSTDAARSSARPVMLVAQKERTPPAGKEAEKAEPAPLKEPVAPQAPPGAAIGEFQPALHATIRYQRFCWSHPFSIPFPERCADRPDEPVGCCVISDVCLTRPGSCLTVKMSDRDNCYVTMDNCTGPITGPGRKLGRMTGCLR